MLTEGMAHAQVVLGTKHAYTFDCVYGGNGRDEVEMFHECIRPLVQGIVEGYNGTVRGCRVIHARDVIIDALRKRIEPKASHSSTRNSNSTHACSNEKTMPNQS